VRVGQDSPCNEEKAGLRKQVNELVARLKVIEESNKESSKALMATINELSATVKYLRKESELMRKQLEAKEEVNRLLTREIFNLRLQLEDSDGNNRLHRSHIQE
jgi:transposase